MDLNVMTAFVAAGFISMVGVAYVPLLRIGLASWMVLVFAGIIQWGCAMVLRSGYWDIGQFLLGEQWQAVRAMLGGQKFSALFNLLVISGAISMMRGRLLLVPERERKHWRWWNAWGHPWWRCRFTVRKKYRRKK